MSILKDTIDYNPVLDFLFSLINVTQGLKSTKKLQKRPTDSTFPLGPERLEGRFGPQIQAKRFDRFSQLKFQMDSLHTAKVENTLVSYECKDT